MASANLRHVPGRVPDGYAAVAVSEEQLGAPVRLCVLVKKGADEAGGRLVTLRETLDARVLLGCLCDAGGQAVKWVEVWVQDVSGAAESAEGVREALTNRALDDRWRRQCRGYAGMEGDVVVRTGWEEERPRPLFVDVGEMKPVHPVDGESGAAWRLCTNDGLLEKKGLGTYSGTCERYLYIEELGAESPFVGVSDEEGLRRVAGGAVAVNAGCGFLMVRSFAPTSLGAWLDVLGGGAWEGVSHGRKRLEVEVGENLSDSEQSAVFGEGGLFLGRAGRWGRLVEGLHLKLRAVADAVDAVAGFVKEAERPLLNVSAESFQVRLDEPARGLPYLWSARTVLVDPGDAVALPVAGGAGAYFLSARARGHDVYRAEAVTRGTSGRGTVRVRGVKVERGDEVVVDATLATDAGVEASGNDLVWLRLRVGGERVDLYARVDSAEALAKGEWRLKTVPQRMDETGREALKSAEGVALSETLFEVIPVLSSPCDLYSLAVLAVRALLTGGAEGAGDGGTGEGRNTLAVAVDEMVSLARQAAAEHASPQAGEGDKPLEERIRAILMGDERFMESLGPQRLTVEAMGASEALDLVPLELWCAVLATIARMLPGVGPDSAARDFGDARGGGLHLVFERAQRDLSALLMKTRSLIVIDWSYNREVHAVLRGFAVGTG